MNPNVRNNIGGSPLKQPCAFAVAVLCCLLVSILLWQGSEPVDGQVHAVSWVRSKSFSDGRAIPRQYTCDGADISPQLEWPAAPANTKSIAIVMDDPDAPIDFTHWLAWNIAPQVRELAEGASQQGTMPTGSLEGENDFGKRGYGGPCPPRGNPHHYFFKVYALDILLDLPGGATRKQVDAAMSGHILAQGQIIGTYQRVSP
jgi:Raf kinase inhibitor-like YbhB/YbcL family protein